jgi:UDP-GlcNAc3NAcA epimerase
MSVVVVVGNRPQFIKFAPISRAFRETSHSLHVIHSGQHYDDDMSGVFFRDLGLAPPDETYSTTNSSHAKMTADILVRLEESLERVRPKGVIVFGDTNTTLAAVLAASKMNIEIAHIEAGPRTGNRRVPEEQNRVVADHLSAFKFCPDPQSVTHLAREGISEGVVLAGDTMLDAYRLFASQNQAAQQAFLANLNVARGNFTLLTIHRPINTNTPEALNALVAGLQAWREPVVFPVHPRTKQALARYHLLDHIDAMSHVKLMTPLGYLDMVALLQNCRLVATDSGGLQKEAYFAGKPCLTLDSVTPWDMLAKDGWITLAGSMTECQPETLASVASRLAPPDGLQQSYFGDGHAAMIIKETLIKAGWWA